MEQFNNIIMRQAKITFKDLSLFMGYDTIKEFKEENNNVGAVNCCIADYILCNREVEEVECCDKDNMLYTYKEYIITTYKLDKGVYHGLTINKVRQNEDK